VIPESVNRIYTLKHLLMANNKINSIPDNLGEHQLLVTLDFRKNKVPGLPQDLSRLRTVEVSWSLPLQVFYYLELVTFIMLMLAPLPGVWITTRQLAKCEQNSGLASKNTSPLASLVSFSPLSLTLSIFLASCFLAW
jgi:hypothetical protein